ncbi:unnamed protein product [Calypogeia fissa]
MAGNEPPKAAVTGDQVPNDNGASGSSTVASPSEQNPIKREAPDSLRRLSDALEGWKNKQDEINKKFLDSFEQIGSDLSKIHNDTGNLRRTYVDLRDIQRKASVRSTTRKRSSLNRPRPPAES